MTKKKVGRPKKWNLNIETELLSQLAEGVSMVQACKPDHMPCKSLVFQWMRDIPGFMDRYKQAKAECADFFAEQIIEIADDGTNDYMSSMDDGGGTAFKFNGEHVQRSRLRCDSRKWIAARLMPDRYGDRVKNEHSGPDGEPIKTETTTFVFNPVGPDD